LDTLDVKIKYLMHKTRAGLLFIFIADLMFGGSLGVYIFEFSVRKLLLIVLLFHSLAFIGFTSRIMRWQIILVNSVVGILVFWCVLIPMTQGRHVELAIVEGVPLIILFITLPFWQAFEHEGISKYLNFANRCMAVVAFTVIVAWVSATFFQDYKIPLSLIQYFKTISGSDFGIYIGPMPDGSYRVMWITCIFMPFILLVKNIPHIKFGWTVYYMIAIYATGTRSFFYASILSLCSIFFIKLKNLLFLLLTIIFVLVLFKFNFLDHIRIFEIASEFESDSPRLEQFFSLARLFLENPMFGTGFGGSSDLIRSDDAPFSYELTYVALLAKMGILGIGIILVLCLIFFNIALNRFHQKMYVVLIAFCFIFITSTNPYLLNYFGISILSIFLAATFSNRRS
jgi:hypothetical protein